MRLLDVTTTKADGRIRLSGLVDVEGSAAPLELFFEFPLECESWLSTTGDAFVPALLPRAMQHGTDLHLDVPVTDEVIDWAIQFQDLYTNWYPQIMQRITIHAPHRQPMRDAGTRHVAAFFSMGVDSFYTLLKNMRAWPSPAGAITHLLYVEGLDTPLRDVDNGAETRAAIQAVARAAGKELIVGRTNLRDDSLMDYGLYYAGPCLSAVALSIAPALSEALIANATDYRGLYAGACHPLVEGRIRAGHFQVISDGGERNRLHRIVDLVGTDPLSLKYLRVCTQNRSGVHNCGQCQKCLRTMVTLHLMGVLKKAPTFPHEFNARTVRHLCIRNDWDMHYLQEILEYAVESDADPAVTRELRRLFGIYRRWNWWQRKLAPTPLRFVVPMLDHVWRRIRGLRSEIGSRNGNRNPQPGARNLAAVNER